MAKGKFITSKQAAEKLGFTPDYIRRLCVDGKIKGEKYGNTWVINANELKRIKRQRYPKENSQDGVGSEE